MRFSLATLFLAAAVLLASSAHAQNAGEPTTTATIDELLEFDPPMSQFKLDEMATTATPLRMRLRQPNNPYAATLYLQAPNMKFDVCQIKFPARGTNEWQTVGVRALPYFTDADRGARNEVVEMKMSCPRGGKNWHGRTWSYPVQRPVGAKGATCSSTGDPHLSTFDSKRYDYQGLGCFYLLKSPAMTVQTVTDTWNNGATVSVATAIRYGPAHFIVDARESTPEKRLVRLSGDAHGVDVVVSTDNNEFRFRFPDGAAVTITYHGAQPRSYLDHQIDVPACYQARTRGLCGTFNGNQADDFTAANDQVTDNANTFGDSWRVPATDDMFTCKDRCPDALAASHPVQPCDLCRIPTGLEGSGVYRDDGPGYSRFVAPRSTYSRARPTYPAGSPRHLTLRAPTGLAPDFGDRARAACTAAIDIADARHIIDPAPYIENCFTDCNASGSLEMVESNRVAYANEVATHVRPVMALVAADAAPLVVSTRRRAGAYSSSPEAVHCTRAADALGLGARRCPNNCSNNGRCLRSGCVCRPGYTGIACAKRLDAYGIPVVSGGRARAASVYTAPRSMVDDRDLYDDEVIETRRPVSRAPVSRPRTLVDERRTPVDNFPVEEQDVDWTLEESADGEDF